MANILVTGACSSIGHSFVEQLIKREIVTGDDLLVLTDRPKAYWQWVDEDLRGFDYCCTPVDLGKYKIVWTDHINGLVLCAAAGLGKGLSREQVRRINFDSQVRLAEQSFDPKAMPGCRGVFITSLWGHNRKLRLPDKAYEAYLAVAEDKHDTERRFRIIENSFPLYSPQHSFNFVVASLVEKTPAYVLFKRALRKGFDAFVQTLPEKRTVTIDEVADAMVKAYTIKESGQTIFVPKSAGNLADENMLMLSK